QLRQGLDRYVFSREQTSHLAQGRNQRCYKNVLGLGSRCLGLLCERCQDTREAARLNGAWARIGGGCGTAQVTGGCLDCRERIGRRRFRFDLVRIERIPQKKTRVVDDCKLLILLLGNETLQRNNVRNLRQLTQAFSKRGSARGIAFKNIESVWAGIGV